MKKSLILKSLLPLLSRVDDAEIKEKITTFFCEDVLSYYKNIVFTCKNFSSSKWSIKEVQNRINMLCNAIVEKGYELEKLIGIENSYSRILIRDIKEEFRKLMYMITKNSYIINWATRKPRGYPGDYKMLEIMYDNRILSNGIGRYLDEYLLGVNSVVSVRYRRDKMIEIMKDFIQSSASSKINILDVGCGGSRILRTFLEQSEYLSCNRKLAFTNIDQDRKALDYSETRLRRYSSSKIKFNFIKASIINLIDNLQYYYMLLGKEDLIYNIGVADYLPDNILIRFIKFSCNILKPGGKFVISFKDFDIWNFVSPDWFCNWTFVHRNLYDVISLMKRENIDVNKKFKLEITWTKTEDIFFLIITKKLNTCMTNSTIANK